MTGAFFETTSDGLLVRVRLHPAARKDGITGMGEGVDGRWMLKAAVTKPPEGGKANQALIKMLAREWRVAKSSFAVYQGQTNRNKVLKLHGEARELAARLKAWAAQNDF